METLRIGLFNPFFYPYVGGTENVIYEIGKRLAKKGHQISIYASKHHCDLPAKEEFEGMVIHRADAHIVWKAPPQLIPPFPIFKSFNSTAREFMKENDLAHINNRFIFSYPHIRFLGKMKPVMLTVHNATPQNIDFFTDFGGQAHDRLFLKRAYKYLKGATAITKAAMEMTLPGYRGLKEVIWNGVDAKKFRPIKNAEVEEIPKDKPIILTNCRLVRQKGIEYLINAMKGVDARLVILGRGPLEQELKTLAKNENVDAIFITKIMEERKLVELINMCDIFVLPSLYETFGLAALEAMACGKPVIATNIHGLPEVVGDSGIMVAPRDVKGMRSAIQLLLEDRQYASALGRMARKRALKNFRWDNIAIKYALFYKKLLSE